MKLKTIWALLVVAVCLAGCGQQKGYSKMISLDGVPIDNPSLVARIREGSMYVRGIDHKRMQTQDIQNPFTDFVYVVRPGHHALLLMNIQSGHIIPTENMRCYIVDAELKADITYRVDEDKSNWLAVIKREDTGEPVGSAKIAVQDSAFGNPCDWK